MITIPVMDHDSLLQFLEGPHLSKVTQNLYLLGTTLIPISIEKEGILDFFFAVR